LFSSVNEGDGFALVYRVNWLRAKARKERWEEEMVLVMSEMDWTANSFHHHEKIWKQRAEEAKGPGHIAYAWKQNSTWGRWAKIAEDTFGALKNV
jgi:hypothetical protein